MDQCCSRTCKCCLPGTRNEAENQGETNGQADAIFDVNEPETVRLMPNINRTETSNQAQKQDESNGQI